MKMLRYAFTLVLAGLLFTAGQDVEGKDKVLDRTGQKFITQKDVDLLVVEIVNKLIQTKASRVGTSGLLCSAFGIRQRTT